MSKRRYDQEAITLNRVIAIIETLPDIASRYRVVRYLADRFSDWGITPLPEVQKEEDNRVAIRMVCKHGVEVGRHCVECALPLPNPWIDAEGATP
jgi:hypothetical protein